MYFIGVDHHKQASQLTVLAEDGRELKTGRVLNLRRELERFLKGFHPFTAVIEAGRSSYVMADLLRELGGEVKMANALQVKAIAQARIKTDKRDSRTLAHLLRADLIPEIYQRGERNRQAQRILRARAHWVSKQTEIKNKIRALMAQQKEEIRLDVENRKEGLFSAGGIECLNRQPVEGPDKMVLDDLLQGYQETQAHIKKSDEWVRELYGELEEAARIERITKQGSRWLRWAAVEAVYPAIQKDRGLRVLYNRLAKRKGPNAAKIAVARRLLTIIYRIMTEKRTYLPDTMNRSAA